MLATSGECDWSEWKRNPFESFTPLTEPQLDETECGTLKLQILICNLNSLADLANKMPFGRRRISAMSVHPLGVWNVQAFGYFRSRKQGARLFETGTTCMILGGFRPRSPRCGFVCSFSRLG